MSSGTLYIISAPSGCGKTSLVNAILRTTSKICVAVSYTTRPPRPNETEGLNYHFVTIDQFQALIQRQAFLEYAQVFNHYYGTPIGWVEEKLAQGVDVILEIDWQGAKQIKQKMPNAISIFLLPPSQATLYTRLKNRGQDSEETIQTRMHQARIEIAHHTEYDYLIVNTEFEKALSDFKSIIQANCLHINTQANTLHSFINTLLKEPYDHCGLDH